MPLVDDACICYHFYCWICVTHPLDTIPVRCCMMVVKEAEFGEEESPGTDAGRQAGLLILPHNPVEETLIFPFTTCAQPSRNNQNVERWVILNRRVRFHKQPATAGDNPIFLGNRHDVKEPGFVAMLSAWASHGKDLERATEVEHFDIIKDQNANGGNVGLVHQELLSACLNNQLSCLEMQF